MTAIAFSLFVIAAFPEKAHAMRGGWLSPNSAAVVAVTIIPFAIGVFLVSTSFTGVSIRNRHGVIITSLVVVGVSLLVVISHVQLHSDFLEYHMDGVSLPSFVGWRNVAWAAATFTVSLVIYHTTQRSHTARLLLLMSAVGLTAIAGLKIVEIVASQSTTSLSLDLWSRTISNRM